MSTFINRPPKEVFDFITNPAYFTKWQGGALAARWASDGPVGVGSIMHTEGQFMGRKMQMDMEVTQWNPPEVYSLKGNSGPIKFENVNKFEPKDGGTLVVQSFQGETGGFFKLAEGLAVKQMQKQFQSDIQALKKLLEDHS